jgi:hypothetical protein
MAAAPRTKTESRPSTFWMASSGRTKPPSVAADLGWMTAFSAAPGVSGGEPAARSRTTVALRVSGSSVGVIDRTTA